MFVIVGDTAERSFDVAVVGGGAAGLAAALVAAIAGLRTVVFAPPATFPPGRTAALLQGSIDLLASLDVWPALAPRAAPLRAIRIIDGTRRLLRAPEIEFHASEVGLPAFGFNIPNGDLVDALRRHAEAFDGLTLVGEPVERIEIGANAARLLAPSGAFTAGLVVGADGAHSLAREAASIRSRQWSYPQSALVAVLSVDHPHRGISTEFHTETGPFTLVPLPGQRMSLVWVDRPDRAEARLRLPPERLARAIEERAASIHGGMRLEGPPALFPLHAALADRFAANRTILVGEAAHTFPPIGAQGLNLGFRDVAALRRVLARHRGDPGGAAAVAAYHSARLVDIRGRTLAVHVLNRSLLTDFLPVQAARGAGAALATALPAFRRALMWQGLAGRSGRLG